MRLGAWVFGYTNAKEWAELHVRHGYGAAYWPLRLGADMYLEEEYVCEARRHDLLLAEVGVWNNLLAADNLERKKNMEDTVRALKLADRVHAVCCVNISGSLSDTWDGPHPDNLTDKTFRRVTDTICRILDQADPQHTCYTVEPMPWMYPDGIESMRRLLDAVDHPRFAVHADMCNLMNSFDRIFRNGAYTREFFREFGSQIRSVHAKDIQVGKKLTMHVQEVLPGEGIFDYEALLSACGSLNPDLPVMAEHLDTEEEYVRATGYIRRKAEALGLPLLRAHLPKGGKV